MISDEGRNKSTQACQKDCPPGNSSDLAFSQLPCELRDGQGIAFLPAVQRIYTDMPCSHDEENEDADEKRNPTAFSDFRHVGDEENYVDTQEQRKHLVADTAAP